MMYIENNPTLQVLGNIFQIDGQKKWNPQNFEFSLNHLTLKYQHIPKNQWQSPFSKGRY